LPDKPSLAVLPFADMGGDPAQGYFADGITEELTTAFARCRWLFVAARNSSFAYKGQAADVRRVGRELGVRYVLQGSVRRASDRLRITGQLVEAENGVHVWADRHDGTLEDVFDLQDRVTASVVAAIEPALMSAEAERSRRLRPASMAAYDLFLRALSLSHGAGREGTKGAMRLLSLATTTADPDYAPSYALLAQCHAVRLSQGWCDDVEGERREGARLAHAAVERGRDDPSVLSMAGYALGNCSREYETASAWLNRSLALNPNSAAAAAHSGWMHCYLGEPEAAAERFRSALRLSPIDPAVYSFQSGLALALHLTSRYEEALHWAARSLAEQPGWLTAHRVMAATLAHLGRLDEAREMVRQLLEFWPGYRVRETRLHFRPSAYASGYIEGLLKAGAPE
jgi:adenylate cyclase